MPPILESRLATGPEGQPEIRLRYKFNEWDQHPKRITLKRLRSLPDAETDRIPAYYALDPGSLLGDLPAFDIPSLFRFDPAQAVRPPKITIVAAPGVSVEFIGWTPQATPTLDFPRLDLFRVQNPRLVPTIGTDAVLSGLVSNYFVDTNPSAAVRASTAADGGDGSGGWVDVYNGIFDSRLVSEPDREAYLFGFAANVFRSVIHRMGFDPMRIFEGESPIETRTETLMEPSFLQIALQPDGAIFTHPNSSLVLFLEVPQFHDVLSGNLRTDHEARFAYRINPPRTAQRGRVMPLITIVKTAAVKATLTSIEHGMVVNRDGFAERRRREQQFFEIFGADFADVPPQGAPLPRRGLRRARINYVPDPLIAVMQTLFDVMIGVIPYVGDAADVAEFAYAVSTDRDRWGRRVATWEKVLMGIGAVLPFVGGAALRAGPRLARAFGESRQAAERLQSAVDAAGFTAEERRFLDEMAEHLRQGRRLSLEQIGRSQELIRRIPRCSA